MALPVRALRERRRLRWQRRRSVESPQGAGVIVKATHMCMAMRGVSHDGVMTTSSLKGSFLNNGTVRAEFMALANTQSLNKL